MFWFWRITFIADSPVKQGISFGYLTDQETSKPSDTDGDKDVCLIDLTETDDEDSDDDVPMAASSTSSTPSVMSSSPPAPAPKIHSSSSSSVSSRCVGYSNSPPLISLDTPPRLSSRTPPSLPRTPQPLHRSHYSPHLPLSPHHSISSRSSMSPRITPPPAHQGSVHSSSYMPQLEPISDADFDEFLALMAGANRGFPAHPFYSAYYPFLSPFAAASHFSSSSSGSSHTHAMPENLSVRESKNYAMK